MLEDFGFKRTDAEVYVYLAKKGPQTVKDMVDALKMSKQRLYLILKNLKTKSVITVSSDRPMVFTALPFEKILDLLEKTHMEQVDAIKTNMKNL
jgi:sugar-specific transcriptional regulator TrmB